jgi:hypothetical protein
MRTTSLAITAIFLLCHCGDAPSSVDAGRDAASATVDAATASIDTGAVAIDSGAFTPDAGSVAEPTHRMANNECYTFATMTSVDSMSGTCGDMQGLTGINVDLSTPDSGFCPLTGTFTSLASVPSDYSACAWTSYVEGADPLANRGYIVRDAAHVHHYKMRIISNLNPTLVFSFAQID